jgi:predicted nucleic acid-binding protein
MKMRIYVDTSVIGGCLDEEFAEQSRALLQMAHDGKIVLLVSDLLVEELAQAPENIRRILEELHFDAVEPVEASPEAQALRDAYLASGVLGQASVRDAEHVAVATVAKADLVVSWNFKHIVHVDKIRKFNAVNLSEGYGLIDIRSPLEVI